MSTMSNKPPTAGDFRASAPVIPDHEPLRLEGGASATRYVIRFALNASTPPTFLEVEALKTADDKADLVLALPFPDDVMTADDYFRRLFLLEANRVRLTEAVGRYRAYRAQHEASQSGRRLRPPISDTDRDSKIEVRKADGAFQITISKYKH